VAGEDVVGEGTLYAQLVGMKISLATMEISTEVPQKKKKHQKCHTIQLLLGTSKGNEVSMLKRYLHTHVHCVTVRNNQDRESACQLMNG
jgi:hypothetical protein